MTEVAHARSLIESIADPIGLHIKSSALNPTGSSLRTHRNYAPPLLV
ncbi:MAG: hypothetical protein ACREYE_15730 [Gammaproteobacteria bacterium]